MQEIIIDIYQNAQLVAQCPIQVSAEEGCDTVLEDNQIEIEMAITAAISTDRVIADVVVQNPLQEGEKWEVLYTDGERAVFHVEYEY